jgi:radical SAM superfamily enzyme YgiQ (UPF0313 family)
VHAVPQPGAAGGCCNVEVVLRKHLKIKLVEPSKYHADGRLFKVKQFVCPPLTLPYLAALVPDDVQVAIESEFFGDIHFDEPADLVGITVYTTLGMRAYEVADEFRRRGVPVVLGGIHASMVPDEAARHADTVIVGEAEETWPRFIADFRNGTPKKRYVPERPPPLERLPVPRFALLNTAHYIARWRRGLLRSAFMGSPWYPVQTARGCPHGCDYCAVTAFNGRAYRTRPIADVVREIETLRPKSVFFVDDDIFVSPRRAAELFKALIPLRIRWVGQGSINAAKRPELLELARAGGCRVMLVGVESLSRRELDSVGKRHNVVEEYEAALRAFRRAGIVVQGNMMFGFGPEAPGVFDEAADFLIRNRVALTKWWPVIPLPGTGLYARLKAQGRLKDEQWWLRRPSANGLMDLQFTGLEMGEDVFRDNYARAHARFYSLGSIAKRVLLPPGRRWAIELFLNLLYKIKMTQETTSIEA